MMKLLAGLLVGLCLMGQTREEALRGRVTQFWKAFEEAKYRKADALVLDEDEAKESFFSWPKKQIFKQEPSEVKFSEDGKMARVMTPVETDEFMVGVGRMRTIRPVITFWKLDGDQWWWFQPKNQIIEGPFGKWALGPTTDPTKPPTENFPAARPRITLEELWKLVTPDRTELKFDIAKAGQQEIQFKNGMSGMIGLILDVPPREELSVSVDPKEIPRGSVGVVTVKYTPMPAGTVVPMKPGVYDLRVTVAQTGKTHTIKLTFE
jgi:hypothetical protein